MSEAQVARSMRRGHVQPRITLVAPSSGVVAELMAREGMTVMPGDAARAHQRPGQRLGQRRAAREPGRAAAPRQPGRGAQPRRAGAVFRGSVQALLPEVNATTRTLKARVQFANPSGQLVPGLFVTMQFMDTRAGKACWCRPRR
jgi:Cu(I)/Ag(I) efflux system membrane fusion protein